MVARQQVLDRTSDLGSCRHAYTRLRIMTRFRRMTMQRNRQVNEECHRRRKRLDYEKWQSTQIQIWKALNEQALQEEENYKNSPQTIDKTEKD